MSKDVIESLTRRAQNAQTVHAQDRMIEDLQQENQQLKQRELELMAALSDATDALGKLLYAKRYKDKNGKDAHYEVCKELAWKRAYEVDSRKPQNSLAEHDAEVIEAFSNHLFDSYPIMQSFRKPAIHRIAEKYANQLRQQADKG